MPAYTSIPTLELKFDETAGGVPRESGRGGVCDARSRGSKSGLVAMFAVRRSTGRWSKRFETNLGSRGGLYKRLHRGFLREARLFLDGSGSDFFDTFLAERIKPLVEILSLPRGFFSSPPVTSYEPQGTPLKMTSQRRLCDS